MSATKTPSPKKKDVPNTPLSKGTASQAQSGGYHPNLELKNIKPYVRADAAKFGTFEMERMIAHFVDSVCVPGRGQAEGQQDSEFLQPFLTAVQPIAQKLRGLAQAYVDAANALPPNGKREVTLYPKFVELANTGFIQLKKLDVAKRLVKASDLDVLFQVMEPAVQKGTHNNQVSHRRVDVALTTSARIQHAHGCSSKMAKIAVKECLQRLPYLDKESELQGHELIWRYLLRITEFKATQVQLEDVPENYTDDPLFESLGHLARSAIETTNAGKGPVSTSATEGKRGSEANEDDPESGRKRQKRSHTPTVSTRKNPPRGSSNVVSEDGPPIESGSKGNSQTLSVQVEAAKADIGEPDKLPPMLQCATYAVEMLNHSPWMNHAMVDLIVNDELRVWWYDREGPLQSSGINFIQHLPHFLLLLLSFQRFRLGDWGIDEDMIDDTVRKSFTDPLQKFKSMYFYDLPAPPHGPNEPPNKPVPVYIATEPNSRVSSTYALKGRDTMVSLCNIDRKLFAYALKQSWQEFTREREDGILRDIIEEAGDDPRIKGHLPEHVATWESAYNTRTIRAKLQAKSYDGKESLGRRRVSILQKRLQPAHKLSGMHFLRIWLQCIICHFAIWTRCKTQHTDPSLNNLMYDTIDDSRDEVDEPDYGADEPDYGADGPANDTGGSSGDVSEFGSEDEDGPAEDTDSGFEDDLDAGPEDESDGDSSSSPAGKETGILIDWDLALSRLRRQMNRTSNTERTGTIPFMALDLLKQGAAQGNFKRFYRHDLEAFIWVLVWMVLRYVDGEEQGHDQLDRWLVGDYLLCRERKMNFLSVFSDIETPAPGWEPEWKIAHMLLRWIREGDSARAAAVSDARVFGTPVKEEIDDPAAVYQEFCARIRLVLGQVSYLGDLLAELQVPEPEIVVS